MFNLMLFMATRLWWIARHSISPIEFLNRSYPFFEFVFAPARVHAV